MREGLFTPCLLGQAHRAGLSPWVLEGLPNPRGQVSSNTIWPSRLIPGPCTWGFIIPASLTGS